MKVVLYIFFLSFFIFLLEAKTVKDIKKISSQASAITYQLNGGRFGDNLLSYSRAKWLSYVYGIPVLYFSFPYADQLALSHDEAMYEEGDESYFNNIEYINLKRNNMLQVNNNTLYVSHWKSGIKINWNEKAFVDGLKKSIAPLKEYEKIIIPEGYVSVAVHVRNGGGYSADHAIERARCPLRFVPEEFFIKQIARIAEMFPEQQLYVHIFTDHPEPSVLAEKFTQALCNDLITFGYRSEGNSYKANVLDDFFGMMDFSCLIRPGSHFSRFVERLGNAILVIYPESARKVSDDLSIIDKIGIKRRTAKGWKTQFKVIA